MKIEEIIRLEEQTASFLRENYPKQAEPMIENSKIIIAALEKQIQKEPVNKFEYLKFQTGYCPRCSTSVCAINHYCTVCGQALKWSD